MLGGRLCWGEVVIDHWSGLGGLKEYVELGGVRKIRWEVMKS